MLAQVRGTRLIHPLVLRGLDAHAAMYEWNYQRQLLAIKLLEQDHGAGAGDLRAPQAGHLLPSATCSNGRYCRRSAARSRRCC